MPKLRVYQLARELNRDNTEIIRELQHMGVPVTSHSNTVEDRLADRLRKELGVFVPQAGKSAAAEEVVEAVEAPAPVETAPPPSSPPPPPPPVHVEEEAPRPQAKAEPKVEPKVEEKVPEPVAKVAAPPAPPAPPVTPPPVVPKVEAPAPPTIQTRPTGGRIIPPPPRVGPAVPPKFEPPHEQRKTMQQIVQERLQKEHRLPPTPAPGQRRP